MVELASASGIGGVAGFLLGVLLATWVDPATSGGWALLVVVSIGIGAVLGFLFSAVAKLITR